MAGKHYISTSIDDLGVAIERIASRPDTWRRRVARKGQAAIQALLAERSILCYVRLATDLAASRSPASASLACVSFILAAVSRGDSEIVFVYPT